MSDASVATVPGEYYTLLAYPEPHTTSKYTDLLDALPESGGTLTFHKTSYDVLRSQPVGAWTTPDREDMGRFDALSLVTHDATLHFGESFGTLMTLSLPLTLSTTAYSMPPEPATTGMTIQSGLFALNTLGDPVRFASYLDQDRWVDFLSLPMLVGYPTATPPEPDPVRMSAISWYASSNRMFLAPSGGYLTVASVIDTPASEPSRRERDEPTLLGQTALYKTALRAIRDGRVKSGPPPRFVGTTADLDRLVERRAAEEQGGSPTSEYVMEADDAHEIRRSQFHPWIKSD